MIIEDKELLLKYLCMALPYGVKCHFKYGSAEDDITLSCIDNNVARFEYGWYGTFHVSIDADYIKPYLRPMSSMTDEDLQNLSNEIGLGVAFDNEKYELWLKGHTTILDNSLAINWLLEHHYDFMGLIPKGLAIEVTEENNPYKE